MFTESVKYLAEVRLVLILSVAKHENIVQIHQHEIIDVPMHNGICYDSLFGFWGFSCSHSVVYDDSNTETMVLGTGT